MPNCFRTLLFALLLALVPASVLADEVRLKSGEVLKGRIVAEAEDFLRIEVAVSDTIRETKMVSRADIAEVIKEAPDNVEFAKIEQMLPTPSLLGINDYRSLLETGPDAFLRNFPESEHVGKVREIREALAEESAKAERGFVKIGEDWISPQERAEFEARVNSRIGLERMRRHAERGDPNSLILAMREFEAVDQRYRGTPGHVEAVELALSVVPNLGRQMQGLLRDVEYRNAEWERNKAAMEETARAQVEAARKREEEQFKAAVDADKRAGIKWTRFDTRSKASLESYLKLAEAELNTLQAYDLGELRRQATLLSQADDLIARGELTGAGARLAEAGSVAAGRSKAARKSSGGRGATTYAGILTAKLNAAQAERTAQAKAREAAAKAKSITARRRADGKADPEATETEAEPSEEGAETAAAAAEEAAGEAEEGAAPAAVAEERTPVPQDDFAALAGTPRKGAKAAAGEATPSGEAAKSARPAPRTMDPEERARRAAAANTGGGFPKWLIIPIVTALLVVTVVVLKVTGIGMKKEDAEE